MARYNKIVSLVVLIALMSQACWAGGLDRIAVAGVGVGNGGNSHGAWIPENLASWIQAEENFFEIGTEVMVPSFKIIDRLGRDFQSKSMAYALPWVSYARRLSEERVFGLSVITEYGIGASFEKSFFGRMDSESQVSGTYIRPFIAQRLTDKLSIGLGLNLVSAKLAWRGPLDIDRHYLPIDADTKAIGWGIGYSVGLFYQPTENWALGINYMSSVKADMFGRTEVLSPFKLRDSIRTSYEFPDRLTLSAGKKFGQWLVVADMNYYGYSNKSLESAKIQFSKLLITKPLQLNWRDNIVCHAGVSRPIGEHWIVGAGLGYMSQAVPDKTADFMTPDVAGYSIAGRVQYHNENWSTTLGLSRGWGSNKADGREIRVDVYTLLITGTFRF